MGCMGHKRCGDEMDDEEVGMGGRRRIPPPNWDEIEAVGSMGCMGHKRCGDEMDDEDDESVGRSCKDFPMAEDCRRLRHKNLHGWRRLRSEYLRREAECLSRPKTAEHPKGWLYSGFCELPDNCCPWIHPSELNFFRL